MRVKNRDRRARLLLRLGVTAEELNAQPQIGPQLMRCNIRPDRVMEVLRGDSDPHSMQLVAFWDKLLPTSQKIIGLDGLAMAAGLTPRRLWELFCGANLMQSRESIGVMIADALPEIMRVTIRQAKSPMGSAAREHVYKAARVLPTPKGTVINLPGAQPQHELEEPDEDDAGSLEEADGFLLKASRAMNPKALPAPAVIEAEAEDTEDDEEEEG